MFARISTLAAVASLASATKLDARSGSKAELNAAIAALTNWRDNDYSSFTECCTMGYTEEACADINPIMFFTKKQSFNSYKS